VPHRNGTYAPFLFVFEGHFLGAESTLANADLPLQPQLRETTSEGIHGRYADREQRSGNFSDDTASKPTESVTMATFQLATRRLIVVGGFAVAVAAAPAIAALAAPAEGTSAPVAACPAGESEDQFTMICVPDLVPNSPELQSSPGGLPSIDGIPCTGRNSGQCIGLAEEQEAQGPMAIPRSSVSSSP
jgi:hypothetical protein